MSKKILILAMSCNQDFYQREEHVVRNDSYAKDVLDGKYDNVDFWTYTASEDGKIHVNEKTHKIKVPVDDSLYGTYQKTIMALKVLETVGIEYDYIFRTNLSTWVNVRVLRVFVEGIPETEKETIFSSYIYSSKDASGPEPFDLYAVGNSMLIPKFWCDILKIVHVSDIKKYDQTVQNKPDDKKSIYNIDDNAIGFVVNTYCNLNGIDKYSVWKQFRPFSGRPGEFLEFIATPLRIYGSGDREKEFENLRILSKNDHHIDITFPEDITKVYRSLTAFPKIKIINFEKYDSIYIFRDDALEFIKNHEVLYNDDMHGYVRKLRQDGKIV